MSRATKVGSRLGAGLVAGVLTLTLAPGLVGSSSAEPGDDLDFRAATEQAPRQSAVAERAAKGLDSARVPRIRWKACSGGLKDERARCATVQVPLDYDQPRGRTTPLALLKWRAKQPKNKIGSLFVNPGGPGGEARGFATVAGGLLSPAVDRRFDIIGVDPRGVGGSRTSACRATSAVAPYSSFGYPIGAAQVRQQIRHDRALRRLCDKGATPIVDHATTADNARDMELLRRSLGEGRLNYYGVSYGSYLGQTYAAMFPQRIRALAIDGILDPIAWSTGPRTGPLRPFTYRLRSGQGAYRGLTAAFAECDRVGEAKCALAPSSATKWRDLIDDARDGTLVVPGGEGETTTLSEQDLVGTTLGVLYAAGQIKPYFAYLAELHAFNSAPPRRRSAPSGLASGWEQWQEIREEREESGPFGLAGRGAPASPGLEARRWNANVSFEAVACSDTRNPRDPMAWERAARITRPAPWFGRLWTWGSSACAEKGIGDGSDSFRGPWKTTTSTPLLIVGNNYDPATPVRGARRAHQQFAGSSFLFYDGWGHGNLGDSTCVTKAYREYFVKRQLVRDGSTCNPDQRLFG